MSEAPLEYHSRRGPGGLVRWAGRKPQGVEHEFRQTRPATRLCIKARRAAGTPAMRSSRRRSSATILSRERRQQHTPAVQVRLELCQRDCHRLIVGARRQPGSVLRRKKVPARLGLPSRTATPATPAVALGATRSSRVSQPARAGESPTLISTRTRSAYREHAARVCRSRRCASRNSTIAERGSPTSSSPADSSALASVRWAAARRERRRRKRSTPPSGCGGFERRGEMRWRLDTFRPAPATAPGKA